MNAVKSHSSQPESRVNHPLSKNLFSHFINANAAFPQPRLKD